jgi:AcrR family transcriptional regulator
MPRRNNTTEETLIRRKRILELRRDFVSFEDIAEELEISPARVYQIYRDALKEIVAPDVEELRKEQKALINRAINNLLPDTEDDDPDVAAKAWTIINRYLERLSRLMGLDMPSVNVNIEGGKVKYTVNGIEVDDL